MSLSLPNITPYRDSVRIGILHNKIAELDKYTHIKPNKEDLLCQAWCLGGRFGNAPIAYVTTQLQLILTLEEELDTELSKPSEHPERPENKFKDFRVILDLQSRIEKLEKETDDEVQPCESTCFGTTAYLMPTNFMLTKHILEKRLQRELAKEGGNHYNYEPTHGPAMDSKRQNHARDNVYGNSTSIYINEESSTHEGLLANDNNGSSFPLQLNLQIPEWLSSDAQASGSSSNKPASIYYDDVVAGELRRNITRLESDPQLEQRFKSKGPVAFVYSIYNTVKIQDLKNKLRKELAKPAPNDPPSYDF